MKPRLESNRNPECLDLPFSLLTKWESMRGRKTILFWLGEAPLKYLEDGDILVLYECLRSLGPTDRLDLILCTPGGFIHPARQIALLFRQYTSDFRIFLPYRARSAGTLLCLAATELVLGPLAELSPLDPNLRSNDNDPSGASALVSSEDVRAFRKMAEDWFGLDEQEHRLRIFELLCQRFFPTALSSFFRADRQTRRIGEELLAFQLPDVEPSIRQQIIDHLISGYDSHDCIITREEAHTLGLRTRSATSEEETMLWNFLQVCRDFLAKPLPGPNPSAPGRIVNGILLSANFAAYHVVPPMVFPAESQPMPGKKQSVPSPLAPSHEMPKWEVQK
jgi:hypothetical protein